MIQRQNTQNGLVAVIFDIDGTILDSNKKIEADLTETMQKLGIRITPEESREEWYTLAAKYGIPRKQFDQSLDKRKSWEQSLRDGEAPLFEDTIPCLNALTRIGTTLGVLTKSIPSYTKTKLKYHGLEKYFGSRITTIHPREPSKAPAALEITKKMLLERPNLTKVYFIGDNEGDVDIAKEVQEQLGISSYGVYINRSNKSLTTSFKNYEIVKSLEEIPQIIKGGVR